MMEEDSNRFYEFLKTLDDEFCLILESYTAPEGYDIANISSNYNYPFDYGLDERVDIAVSNHLEGLRNRIESMFADKDLLLRALDETNWAKDYIPKALSKDREVKLNK